MVNALLTLTVINCNVMTACCLLLETDRQTERETGLTRHQATVHQNQVVTKTKSISKQSVCGIDNLFKQADYNCQKVKVQCSGLQFALLKTNTNWPKVGKLELLYIRSGM